MKITGKLIGALLGWVLLRHPFGIVIGALFGHLWDIGAIGGNAPATPRDFIGPLFGLAGAIAKSDGRVSEPEIAATENLIARLRLSPAQRADAIARFKEGKQEDFAVDHAIAELRDWCRGRRDRAYILLDLLLELVFAEGATLAPEKIAIVRKLCATLGVHEQELAALAAMRGYGFGHAGGGYRQAQSPPGAPPGKDPYAVLGLSRAASDREVKTAYRRLIGQHHPDKLGDVPEELKRRAEERAREINIAYEKIRAERGFT
jgi:DnaJ like chaperone protein